MIAENLDKVRRNIVEAALKSGRQAQHITLVCVTKEAGIGQVKEAISCGITDIGENRLQNALEKHNLLLTTYNLKLTTAVKWHFIGHLQTNKVKKAVELFDLIHSVDSLYLAEVISKEAQRINKTQDILIQVNTSGEQSKFGARPDETVDLIKQIVLLKNIRVLGLMTIAPLAVDPEKARPCFRKLKELSEEFKGEILRPATFGGEAQNDTDKAMVLSMGMSQDYQAAIEEGATMVRIGSAIFG